MFGVADQGCDLAEVQLPFGEVSGRLGALLLIDDVSAAVAFGSQLWLQCPRISCGQRFSGCTALLR